MEKVEYAGQIVMTRQQLAMALGCTPDQVRNVFRNNKAQFVLGEHYYTLEGGKLREFKSVEQNRRALGKYASQVMLWTQKGVCLLCKLFGTAKAAQIYAELERDYFTLVTVEEPDAVPQIFTVQNVRGYIDVKGMAWLNAEDIARELGFIQVQEKVSPTGNENSSTFGRKAYVWIRWDRVNGYLAEFDYPSVGKDDFLPEYMVYILAMKASNEKAKKFQWKVATDILPTLRRQGHYELKEEKPRKRQSEYACVYGMQMNNNLVKIGCSDDVEERMPEVERESGWRVKDEHHTVRMERKKALREERRLHRKYSAVNVSGEYFNAPFDDVKEDLDEISLTVEEIIGMSEYERGKLLVGLCSVVPSSPLQEKLFQETANLLMGEKIF